MIKRVIQQVIDIIICLDFIIVSYLEFMFIPGIDAGYRPVIFKYNILCQRQNQIF